MQEEENFTDVVRPRITVRRKSEHTQIYTEFLIQKAESFQKYMKTYCINLHIDLDNYIENLRTTINEVFNQSDPNAITKPSVSHVHTQRNIVNTDIVSLSDNVQPWFDNELKTLYKKYI